jgi:phage terminase Nu1 subunit (DNA packaging protein)
VLPKLEKLGMPRERRNGYSVTKVIHWLIDQHRLRILAEQSRRDIRDLQELALLLNREPRTVNKDAKERGLPREGRGIYILSKVLPWIVNDYEKRLREAKSGGETESQARKRLYAAQANLKEITIARQRGEVINIDDAVPILQQQLNIVRQRLLSFKKQLAPQMEGLETSREREQVIDILIYDLLTGLSNIPNSLRRFAKLGYKGAAEGIQDSEAAAPHDRQRVGRRKKDAQRRNRKRAGKVSHRPR